MREIIINYIKKTYFEKFSDFWNNFWKLCFRTKAEYLATEKEKCFIGFMLDLCARIIGYSVKIRY